MSSSMTTFIDSLGLLNLLFVNLSVMAGNLNVVEQYILICGYGTQDIKIEAPKKLYISLTDVLNGYPLLASAVALE